MASAAGPARGVGPASAALLAAAVVVACCEVVVILDAAVLRYPQAFAAMAAWTVVGFVGAGVYWRAQRPANPLGAVFVAIGVLAMVQALQGTAEPLAFSLGVLFDAPVTLLAWYAVLAFPSGRLDRVGRTLMVAATALLTVTFVPWVLTSPQVEGGSPLSQCSADCPENALMVADGGRLAEVLSDLVQGWRLVFAVAIALTLVLRLARASAPRRRSLGPVAVVAIAWIASFGAYGLGVNVLGADGADESALAVGVVVARFLLPALFIVAPIQARAFGGVALEQMVERLGTGASIGQRERVIADALDDPSLRLGFWLPAAGGYVDRHGWPLDAPPPASGRAWTAIGAGDPPEAAIVHDAALSEEPELLRAAGRTLLLALENTRLHEELERASGDLELSRSRLVAAETTGRRRFERELHDRTQQQLVALRVRLGLVLDRADGDPALAQVLAQLGSGLEAVLSDLRAIAGELYPPLLADEGLPAALAAAARHAGASPSRIESDGVGRYSEGVEAAVYFALEEAMSAAAAAPGGAGGAWIRLRDEDGVLGFAFGRDGGGPLLRQEDVMGMSALLGAVGGGVEARTAEENGTVLTGWAPAERRPPVAALGEPSGEPLVG